MLKEVFDYRVFKKDAGEQTLIGKTTQQSIYLTLNIKMPVEMVKLNHTQNHVLAWIYRIVIEQNVRSLDGLS